MEAGRPVSATIIYIYIYIYSGKTRAGVVMALHSTAQQMPAGCGAAKLGDVTWPIIQRTVDAVVTVTDGDIVTAMRMLFCDAKMSVEPSGAAALAAVLTPAFREAAPGCRNVAVVLSGGNVDFESAGFWDAWAQRAGAVRVLPAGEHECLACMCSWRGGGRRRQAVSRQCQCRRHSPSRRAQAAIGHSNLAPPGGPTFAKQDHTQATAAGQEHNRDRRRSSYNLMEDHAGNKRLASSRVCTTTLTSTLPGCHYRCRAVAWCKERRAGG